MEIFKRFLKNESGNIGIILALIGVAVGLLTLAIVLTIGPVVGYNVENSVTVPTTSPWNSGTANTAILNGSEVWAQDTPLLGSAAIVVIASIIISVLLGAFITQRR